MMRAMLASGLGLAACFGAAFPALGAPCPQKNAIYRDSEEAYEIAFEPGASEAQAATHRFSFKVLKPEMVADGFVLDSEPVSRSNGVVMYNCPEGDVTGEDLRACTIWQGVVYGHIEGKIGILPEESKQAAEEILLPGFGLALAASSMWGEDKAHIAPWDVFTLKGCAQ